MKLADLEPAWLESGGQRVALIFLCPHCVSIGKRQWLTCFFVLTQSLPRPDAHRGDRTLFREFLTAKGDPNPADAAWDVVSCNPSSAWKRTTDSFDNMSITPSIDASASGHWHGFIKNGEIA